VTQDKRLLLPNKNLLLVTDLCSLGICMLYYLLMSCTLQYNARSCSRAIVKSKEKVQLTKYAAGNPDMHMLCNCTYMGKICNIAAVLPMQPTRWKFNNNWASNIPLSTQIIFHWYINSCKAEYHCFDIVSVFLKKTTLKETNCSFWSCKLLKYTLVPTVFDVNCMWLLI